MPTTADNKASERKVVTILFSPQAKQEGERAEETFTTDLMAELEQYLFWWNFEKTQSVWWTSLIQRIKFFLPQLESQLESFVGLHYFPHDTFSHCFFPWQLVNGLDHLGISFPFVLQILGLRIINVVLVILQLCARRPGLWMTARLEVTLFWYRPCFLCCVNQVVLMLTRCIYMTKSERSISKQGHLQPRCHSEARSLSIQL